MDAALNRTQRSLALNPTIAIDAMTRMTRCATDALFRRPCTLFLSDAKMQETLKKGEAEVKAEYKVEL